VTIVRWVGCVAATATVWVAKTAKWVQTEECIATMMRIGIATRIADDTETAVNEMIEAGTARTETEATGVTTTKIGPAVA
jgi:hypothetical protein